MAQSTSKIAAQSAAGAGSAILATTGTDGSADSAGVSLSGVSYPLA